MSAALALLAMLIELALGYPQWLFRIIGHPVTWIGRLIGLLDRRLNHDASSDALRRVGGILTVLIVAVVTGSAAYLLQRLLFSVPFGVFVMALVASSFIAQRSLYRHVADVATALETGGVEAGRAAVAHIVGRDAAALDAAGVARAAIESLAENFSDAIVAPVLWMVIAGLPGAAVYKAINTADSMIGHLSKRHAAFGWAAAQAGRSGQSAGIAPCGALIDGGRGNWSAVRRRLRLARDMAGCLPSPLAQCRLSGSRDGGRARPRARRPAHL